VVILHETKEGNEMKPGKGHNNRAGSSLTILSAAGMTVVWLIGAALAAGGIQVSAGSSTAPLAQALGTTARGAAPLIPFSPAFAPGGGQAAAPGGQAAAQGRPMLSDEAFKNVQALKGIPVDDFMLTMGIMTSALAFDCADCHENAGTDRVNWAADTPKKVTARKMVFMVQAINKDNFGGRQMVTCFTCHRNRDRPLTTPTMEMLYGSPTLEPDDYLAKAQGSPPADQIFDKYIQALGGAQRLSGLTSFVAKATSVGFGGFGGGGQVSIYAKAPDQRATIIVFKDAPGRDDSVRAFDGRAGWIRTPLSVLGEYALSGSELDGARLDAQLSFPGQIKQVLTNWRVSESTTIDDRAVQVVQGDGPRGLLATLYFDKDSGLLVRLLRYGRSPIGRIPTQVDYADYRDVGGIKFPFRWTFAWLDGRDSFQLSEVQPNVPIDAARFGRPAPSGGR
jgi:photosynthetic reaction center cytochrome c subunit